MDLAYNKKINGLTSLIGNTPLLEIHFRYQGKDRRIFAKAEFMNMTGSIKDRMAFHILKKAIESGTLSSGKPIFEATSGNTGIAISAIGRALGHPVTICIPNWMSQERINIIRGYGASIELVSKAEGGFLGSIRMANELAATVEGGFLPHQFENEDNCEAHYLTTAPELWWQLKYRGLCPDAFVAGVGTGGTVMGVGRFLKEQHPTIQIHPMEPSNSPTLSTGCKVGYHRIQGISDEFIPKIVHLEELDSIVCVDDGDAIIMAQKLASIGLAVGISSGANFIAALKLIEEMGDDAIVVTVFSDDNKKYLSTDLVKEEPAKVAFLAPDIELTYFKSMKRVCHLCCNPLECDEAEYCEKNRTFQHPTCHARQH